MEVREAGTAYLVQAGVSCPPGFKQTEVGVIPEEWDVVCALNVCSKIQDGTHFSPRIGGRDYLYVTSKNIRFGYLDISTACWIDAAQHQAIYKRCDVKKGDLLLTKDGANTGNAALNVLDEEFSLLSSVAFLRFNPSKHCAAYFLQQILTARGQRQIQDAMAGNAITRLTLEKINKLRFPAPPAKAEQEAIAGALAEADGLIEALEQLIVKKRHLKQGVMQELLAAKRRLPGFSGEWEVKTFGEVFDYHPTATNSRSDLTDGGNTYYIHYGDIHTRFHSHLDFRVDQPPRIERGRCHNATLLRNGDWVMADASEDFDGVGKTIEILGLEEGISAVAGLHTFLLREKNPTFAPGFKGHLGNLKSLHDQFLRVTTGMKVFGVSKAALKELQLPIPSPSEQTAIAAVLSDQDAEIATLEKKLAKARRIKQGMMQELLSGRIRLLRPAALVSPRPVQAEPVPPAAKRHNWQINEAVIIGVLAKHFGSEKYPLARKRCTKLTYLLHRHVEQKAAGYLKKAAGPYNPAVKYKGPEDIAQKNGYVRPHHNGTYPGFVAAANVAGAEAYFREWYGEEVLAWLEQFRYRKTEELELLTTVDMAMEDLCRAGNKVALDTVQQVIREHPEWEAKLSRPIFSDPNMVRAMAECRELFP